MKRPCVKCRSIAIRMPRIGIGKRAMPWFIVDRRAISRMERRREARVKRM